MVTQGVLFTGFFTAIAVQHDKGKWGRLLPRTTHASPWRREGIVKGEEVRWPQSGLIIICRRRRHHTYSLFTIPSTFDCPPNGEAVKNEPFTGSFLFYNNILFLHFSPGKERDHLRRAYRLLPVDQAGQKGQTPDYALG